LAVETDKNAVCLQVLYLQKMTGVEFNCVSSHARAHHVLCLI